VTRHRLNNWRIMLWILLQVQETFFLVSIQTSAGAQPVSLLDRYQEQSCQHMKLTTHLHLVMGQVYLFALCYSVLFFHLIHLFSIVKSLLILLSGLFQVHRFLFSYKAPTTSFLPPVPLLPSPLHWSYLLGWPYLLTSKREAEVSSKMSVPVYQVTWHHSQEKSNLSYLKHWSCYTNQEDNNRSSQPLKHTHNFYYFENRQTPN
jgi:hypothetical protein